MLHVFGGIEPMPCPPEMVPDEMLEFKEIWSREDEEEICGGADNQDIEGSRSYQEYPGNMSSEQRSRADLSNL